MKLNINLKDIILILIGLVGCGLGAAILKVGDLGVDPFTAMNIGIANHLHMQLSILQIIVNAIILVYVFIFNKKEIGIGSILNMLLVGGFVQLFSDMLAKYHDAFTSGIFAKLLVLVIGIAIFTFGCALYMSTGQGDSPYDAIAPTIVKQTGKEYTSVRRMQDIAVVIIAFIFGGPIGIGTVICAFGCGPLISAWTKLIKGTILKEA